MPGGVNSPVRAFKAVGGTPPFVSSGDRPYLTTEDGDRLIDFIASWGALIFGHADPGIVEPWRPRLPAGHLVRRAHRTEVELAELIVDRWCRRSRWCGWSTRDRGHRLGDPGGPGRHRPSGIVKFEGCYHGHADPFLVKAGSGLPPSGEPDSPGCPAATVADTRLARLQRPRSVEAAIRAGRHRRHHRRAGGREHGCGAA
jgi:glutamate-1-semialdehyde 2,1-aminomutase